MTAAAIAAELLTQLKDALTFEGHAKDGAESELPVEVLAEHAVNIRKTHKLMYTQLQVMKFLLDFVYSAPSIQDFSDAAVRKEMVEAKQQWKALKAEYQQQVEAIKEAVPHVLAKVEEMQSWARLLEDALQHYQAKKQEIEEKARNARNKCLKEQELLLERQQQLEQHVAELQYRLQVQREELHCLQGELEEQEHQASVWQEKLQSITDFQHLLETLQGVKVTYATYNELEVELISYSQPVASDPHHLKLRMHWEEDGSISLESGSPFFLLSAVLPVGASSTIRNFIMELQYSYVQQAQLLAEIELLQSCFAIDWQQEKRLLRYLKPSATCCLHVEPGYPASGRICLLSVKSQHGAVDVASYRPPQETPSLQSWLVYLSTVDFSAPFLTQTTAAS
ncbi:ZW10 interactor [Varanus komodoensis]|uniref:ZW10 interactor-like n=1 Tax=Varanus komodoensis TaxID=61221 RepID=UPI001CF7CC3E|nr:ZW10 interactor-like [Varanus komodoensis]KAF7244024.1 ZW10 interactor [Varanus komodoensis]